MEGDLQGSSARGITKRKAAVVGAVAVATAVAATAPPAASTGPSSNGGGAQDPSTYGDPAQGRRRVANNRWHGYSFFGGGSSAWQTAVAAAYSGSYSLTDVQLNPQGSTQHVDVRVQMSDANVAGFWAWVVGEPIDAICGGATPNEWCFKQWLKIDVGPEDGHWIFSSSQRTALMCHEFAHTLGMLHPAPSPNGGAPVPSCVSVNSLHLTTLSAVERGELDAYY